MFARIKRSRNGRYLQIVESYREEGKVRQRVILYVGHYTSVSEALDRLPREIRSAKSRATKLEKFAANVMITANVMTSPTKTDERIQAQAVEARKFANGLNDKLESLRELVEKNSDLV